MVQFAIRIAHSSIGDNEAGFEPIVLEGQASCLSVKK